MRKSFIPPDRRSQMIREIMRDESFLAQKAELATLEDLPVAQDLLDTLKARGYPPAQGLQKAGLSLPG